MQMAEMKENLKFLEAQNQQLQESAETESHTPDARKRIQVHLEVPSAEGASTEHEAHSVPALVHQPMHAPAQLTAVPMRSGPQTVHYHYTHSPYQQYPGPEGQQSINPTPHPASVGTTNAQPTYPPHSGQEVQHAPSPPPQLVSVGAAVEATVRRSAWKDWTQSNPEFMASLDNAFYAGKEAGRAEAWAESTSHGATTGDVMAHQQIRRPPSPPPGPPPGPPMRHPSYTYHDQHVPRHQSQATSSGPPSYEESKYHQRSGEKGSYGGRGKKGGWVETPKSAYSRCEPAHKPKVYPPQSPYNITQRFLVSHVMESRDNIDEPINASTIEWASVGSTRARPQLVRQRQEESTAQETAPAAAQRPTPHTSMVMGHKESTAQETAPAAAQRRTPHTSMVMEHKESTAPMSAPGAARTPTPLPLRERAAMSKESPAQKTAATAARWPTPKLMAINQGVREHAMMSSITPRFVVVRNERSAPDHDVDLSLRITARQLMSSHSDGENYQSMQHSNDPMDIDPCESFATCVYEHPLPCSLSCVHVASSGQGYPSQESWQALLNRVNTWMDEHPNLPPIHSGKQGYRADAVQSGNNHLQDTPGTRVLHDTIVCRHTHWSIRSLPDPTTIEHMCGHSPVCLTTATLSPDVRAWSEPLERDPNRCVRAPWFTSNPKACEAHTGQHTTPTALSLPNCPQEAPGMAIAQNAGRTRTSVTHYDEGSPRALTPATCPHEPQLDLLDIAGLVYNISSDTSAVLTCTGLGPQERLNVMDMEGVVYNTSSDASTIPCEEGGNCATTTVSSENDTGVARALFQQDAGDDETSMDQGNDLQGSPSPISRQDYAGIIHGVKTHCVTLC